jgi:hypothetical protein
LHRARFEFYIYSCAAQSGARTPHSWRRVSAGDRETPRGRGRVYRGACEPRRNGHDAYEGRHLTQLLILFPKGEPRQNLPAVLIYNPYLTKGMVDRFAEYVASFLKNGYAVVFEFENVRGRYYSEGAYTYLGGSSTDGFHTIAALTKQPWSNGKVGTLGCSSSAEEQHRINASHPPGFAAAVPMGSGAGIGKVGP